MIETLIIYGGGERVVRENPFEKSVRKSCHEDVRRGGGNNKAGECTGNKL